MGIDHVLKKIEKDLAKEENQSPKITICTQCVHFINLEPNSPRRDIWYNHLCQENKLPTKIDPYDGKEKPLAVNSLGQEYFSDHLYKYCRDCNEGNCPDFTKKD